MRQIISDRMAEVGMTQRQLQSLTDVHQVRISDYLTGKRDMAGDRVAKLLEALGLEVRPAGSRRTSRKVKTTRTPAGSTKSRQKTSMRKGR